MPHKNFSCNVSFDFFYSFHKMCHQKLNKVCQESFQPEVNHSTAKMRSPVCYYHDLSWLNFDNLLLLPIISWLFGWLVILFNWNYCWFFLLFAIVNSYKFVVSIHVVISMGNVRTWHKNKKELAPKSIT